MSEHEHEVNPNYVRALHRKIENQADELEAVKERLDKLESGEGGSSGGSGRLITGIDSRDQEVIDSLEQGQIVGIGKLQQLYRSKTDVRDANKIKNRIKALTGRSVFRQRGAGSWVYVGDEDE